MPDKLYTSVSYGYEQINKEKDRIEALQREFFLSLCESKAEKRILELIMDNTPPKEILEILVNEDFPEGD